jgi:cytochrome c-type biogenesis protein CcmH
MITFVLLAAALTVAGALAVAIPLIRPRAGFAPPAPWTAVAAGALLVVGSAVLYAAWSNWRWRASTAGDSPQTMVAHLARQLEQRPDDLEGWLMLGRSYNVLQEYPLALRAYERAERLSGGRNVDALTGEAEALVLTDESELDGRAGKLIERALALAPDSGKALFFGALIAERHDDLPLARQRFAKLLAMNPPASVRPVLEQQISAIDEKLASAAAPAVPGPLSRAAASPSATSAAPGDAAVVRVNVSLGPSMAPAGSAPLYVFVRDPARPGPPLAVKRLESRFPQSVSLSASDSVIPGRTLAAGQDVQVVARIARSGNPAGASGDPFGEVAYQVGREGPVSVVIDRVTP